jgi:hypothetical protein
MTKEKKSKIVDHSITTTNENGSITFVQETKYAIKDTNIGIQRGDSITVHGKNTTVVEIIAEGRYHVKNQEFPFDSFIITDEDLEVKEDKNAPDLLYRPDNKASL